MDQVQVRIALGIAAAIGLAFAASAPGQSGGAFRIDKSTLDDGGGRSAQGNYTLDGTIGQADAGPAPGGEMSGGAFRLQGGYWPDTEAPAGDSIFSNGFEG